MDVAAKRAEARRIKEQALAITDKAIAENRALTDGEAKQIAEHVERGKALNSELEASRVGLSAELTKGLQDLGRRPEMWSHLEQGGGPGAGSGGGLAAAGGGIKAAGGKREPHVWTKAILEAAEKGQFGVKGLVGGGQGSAVVGSLGDLAHGWARPVVRSSGC